VTSHTQPMNIVVELIALLLHVQDVLGSDLSLETTFPDRGFS
jgi:hypothetical protein